MTIGIDIRVTGSDKLQQAKRDVDILSGSLRAAREVSTINIDTDGIKEMLAELKGGIRFDLPDLSRFTDAMKGMSSAGLSPQQERTTRAAAEYRKEVERTQKAVAGTSKDYDKLIKSVAQLKGMSNTTSTSAVTAMESERMRKESTKDANAFWDSTKEKPRKTAGQLYFEQHGNMGRTVTSKDDTDDTGTTGRNNSSHFMRKTLGWIAAGAGIGSIASYISASRSAYRSAIDEESPLFAKGLTGSRSRATQAASLGIAPAEYYHLENALSRTGITEKGMSKQAMLTAGFAKFSGLGTEEVTGLRSSLYGATGNNASIPNDVIMAMSDATRKGLDKAKLPELLGMIGRNTNATAQAMHGAGMSPAQVAAITALNIGALSLKDGTSYKQFAKSDNFTNVMQNGLQGAGTAAGDIELFKVMKGFDGEMNWEKIHEMNLMKQQGFLSRPDLLENIIGNTTGSKAARAGQLESKYKAWGIDGAGADALIGMNDSGFLKRLTATKGQSIESLAKSGDKEAAHWMTEISKNPALARQSVEATKDFVKIEAGDKLSKLFEPMELAAAKFTGALIDQKWQQSFDIFGKAASDMGPVAKTLVLAGGLVAAGGAMSMVGGMGKVGAGALGMLAGPGGILAALGLGGAAAYGVFKDGAQGANYNPSYRMNAITGKNTTTGKFSSKWVPFQDAFQNASRTTGVDVNMLYAIARAESGFKPNAISKTGATGVMQLMPGTAQGLGVDPTDPTQNIMGGSKFYKSMLDHYKGDTDKALAAYNWGPGNVDKLVKNNRFNIDRLPKETQQYIQKVKGGAAEYARDDQNTPATGGYDSSMQALAAILGIIAGHTEKMALNAGPQRPTATILPTTH